MNDDLVRGFRGSVGIEGVGVSGVWTQIPEHLLVPASLCLFEGIPDATVEVPSPLLVRTADEWSRIAGALLAVAYVNMDRHPTCDRFVLRVWYGPDRAAATAALAPFMEMARNLRPEDR